jgi:hypothetical protein
MPRGERKPPQGVRHALVGKPRLSVRRSMSTRVEEGDLLVQGAMTSARPAMVPTGKPPPIRCEGGELKLFQLKFRAVHQTTTGQEPRMQ